MSLETIRPGVAFRHDAAASFRRLEAQAGRRLDVNRTTDSRAEQLRKYNAYRAYLAGGPWAPVALHPDYSLHVWRENDTDGGGTAWDTDERGDWLDENGWIADVDGEPWHREYRRHKDQHRNTPAVDEAAPFNPLKEEDMNGEPFAIVHKDNQYLANGRPLGGIVHLTPVSNDILSGGTISAGYWNLKRIDEKGNTVDAGPLIAGAPTFYTHGNQDAFDELVRIYQRPQVP